MVTSQVSLATSGSEFVAKRLYEFPGTFLAGTATCSAGHAANCSVPVVGVCTSISELPPAVEDTARLFPGMPIIVVGDMKGPHNYRPSSNVHFYSVEQQITAMQSANMHNFGKLVPVNSFARKNIGYLLALKMGACMVWDFDDDNFLTSAAALDGPFDFAHELGNGGSQKTLNPYNALGSQHFSWPRGYPIHMLKDHPRATVAPAAPQRASVVQYLANLNPDVDAIYRLTRPIPFNFTAPVQGVLVPRERYVPFNAQATLFHKEAFWTLMLPMSVHGRVSDIWRSYIAQRVFAALGLRWGFHRADVYQDRNAHSLLGDFTAELPLYQTAAEFVRVVDEVALPAGASAPVMLETIYTALYEHGLLAIDDVFAIQHWIAAVCSATATAA